MEGAGGIVSLLMILLALAAAMNADGASAYFTAIIGIGSVLNCILAVLQFRKKSFVLGVILSALSAALLLLFIIQTLLLRG